MPKLTLRQQYEHFAALGVPAKLCMGACGEVKALTEFHRHSKGRSRTNCKQCVSTQKRNLVGYGITRNREQQLKGWYGLTIKEYVELYNKQDGTCAITGLPLGDFTANMPKIKFAVDHIGGTKLVRGLVLGLINRGMGEFQHNSTWLRAAADLIELNKVKLK